jgi:hypothetical protein
VVKALARASGLFLTCESAGAAQLHGRNWAKLSEAVPSKTLTQIKNYYQNYKVKVRVSCSIKEYR